MPSGLNICYYISGHGYGHATRVAQVTVALLQNPLTRITICTKAPHHLFPQSERLAFRDLEVDSDICQPLPYEIDAATTFANLSRFVGDDNLRSWLETEARYVDTQGFNCLLMDAPWIIGRLQDFCQTRFVTALVTNFTFDLIYNDLLQYLFKVTTSAQMERYTNLVTFVQESYQKTNYLVRLPGYIDFPFLSQPNKGGCQTGVIDAPLIYRPPKSTRLQVLDILQIPEALRDHKILLVQFGGFAPSSSSNRPVLPQGWIALGSGSPPSDQFYQFDSSSYLPDLVQASDAVLGKIGYGTVSECIGMAKPLIYVKRAMFAEEPFLLKSMNRLGVSQELSKDDFEAGRWNLAISQIVARKQDLEKQGSTFGMKDASAKVAKIIEGLASR